MVIPVENWDNAAARRARIAELLPFSSMFGSNKIVFNIGRNVITVKVVF